MTEQLLRLDAVLERTGFSRSEAYRRMQAGELPRPLVLPGAKTRVWRSSEIDEALDVLLKQARRA